MCSTWRALRVPFTLLDTRRTCAAIRLAGEIFAATAFPPRRDAIAPGGGAGHALRVPFTLLDTLRTCAAIRWAGEIFASTAFLPRLDAILHARVVGEDELWSAFGASEIIGSAMAEMILALALDLVALQAVRKLLLATNGFFGIRTRSAGFCAAALCACVIRCLARRGAIRFGLATSFTRPTLLACVTNALVGVPGGLARRSASRVGLATGVTGDTWLTLRT